jgi:ferric-dicitrate binding protein FerR (iron transport regulator)
MNRVARLLSAVLAVCSPLLVTAQEATPPASEAPAAPATPPAITWQIAQMEGTVNVKADAAAPWAAAQLNQTLPPGASVQTAVDGSAVLKAGDLAGVTMKSNTIIAVSSLSQDGETTRAEVKALSGKALFLVNKLKTQESSFKVETPTAVVGVRGTAFGVAVAEDGESSRVACFNGEVGVQATGAEAGEVVLKERMGTTVVKNKAPFPPETLPDNEWAEWERVKAEVQTSTIMASVVPAIGGMIEMHQLQNAEADRILNEAKLAMRGNKKAEEDFKVYEAAIVQFFRDAQATPAADAGLEALLNDPGVGGWKGPYLAAGSNLLDPYGRPYKWLVKKSPAGKDVYEVRSGGPDGIVGNDDDHVKLITRARLERLAKETTPAAP